MNSIDPWQTIVTNPWGGVIIPGPYYGHALYRQVPSWVTPLDGEQRSLFDGAFIGADMPSANPSARRGLTAEIAPIVAPATGGITVKKELDSNQVLHVEICVDGKCYSQSMNLAPAIDMVMNKLARWHTSMHATAPQETVVVGTVASAVEVAGDAIVGCLVDHHIGTICGSFIGDIASSVKSAASTAAHGVTATFKKLKGPIAIAAAAAATAGAAAIPGVGPIAAPLAGKLAYDIVNSAGGDPKAQKAVAQAKAQASTDPAVAAALSAAEKAVANSTAAYHVQATATKAAKGDPAAQQQIAQVAQDAEQGDPAAKAVANLVADAFHSEWGAKAWEKVTGRGPATISSGEWYDIVGRGGAGGRGGGGRSYSYGYHSRPFAPPPPVPTGPQLMGWYDRTRTSG